MSGSNFLCICYQINNEWNCWGMKEIKCNDERRMAEVVKEVTRKLFLLFFLSKLASVSCSIRNILYAIWKDFAKTPNKLLFRPKIDIAYLMEEDGKMNPFVEFLVIFFFFSLYIYYKFLKALIFFTIPLNLWIINLLKRQISIQETNFFHFIIFIFNFDVSLVLDRMENKRRRKMPIKSEEERVLL